MWKQFPMPFLFKCLPGNRARRFSFLVKRLLCQSILLVLLFLGFTSTAQAAIPASERQVLLDFYASIKVAGWGTSQLINIDGWNDIEGTECTWPGIVCDGSMSHITGIFFGNSGLVGTLPSLSGLTNLADFVVSDNQLTGNIPQLNGLTSLVNFVASGNQLTGNIPTLSGLINLSIFYAYNHSRPVV